MVLTNYLWGQDIWWDIGHLLLVVTPNVQPAVTLVGNLWSSPRLLSVEAPENIELMNEGGDGAAAAQASPNRRLYINSRQPQRFCSNVISTCKYNALSFLPRFLLEQFRRYNNVFFLVIVLLQQIPNISPTGRYTTMIPFVIILAISALKEIFEDLKRRRSDQTVNNFRTKALRDSAWVDIAWQDVSVGDIIRVEREHLVPADLLLLASSEPHATAYIETSNLDGETNLKIRQGLHHTSHLTTIDKLSEFVAEVECEQPSRHVNEFSGNIHYDGGVWHFGISQLLLRGASLKNTAWIVGAVIYTGHDSKLLQNSRTAPLKRSRIDIMTNQRIVFLFFILVALALISATGAAIWDARYAHDSFYIQRFYDESNTWLWQFVKNVFTFFILYNNLIPISLQVTLEVVRFFQAAYINQDMEMYSEDFDACAIARTSNLNEELGQIKFVMSDKTGTLTRNVMKWKRCSVAGQNFGDDEHDEFVDATLQRMLDSEPDSWVSRSILELLIMMGSCHTVVPEETESGALIYQASSPDESALVKGAASQRVVFKKRLPTTLQLEILNQPCELTLLDVIDFTSDRKRMSVLLRHPDGKIRLYCKGADNVIFERLSRDATAPDLLETTRGHLEEYASHGYRTLCFAARDLSEDEYNAWAAEYKKASLMIEGRQAALDRVAEEVEREMQLVGCTAIEDKLQRFVPETIRTLMEADMRVWMLTGDKRETAINIAHSCALCGPRTELLIVDKPTYEETLQKLRKYAELNEKLLREGRETALVVDGTCLKHAMVGDAREAFARLALACRAVVCCRMSPMQKAEVVELVRELTDCAVLAVGDGANDVAMIQAANVGIGVCGHEGLQAASASDYAIAEFHHLHRLLLVHGACNFDRSVKVILYSFYKNICLYIIELWFAFFSAWSGQTVFERWTIALFNVAFTAFPPVMLGLFDRPLSFRILMNTPRLYVSFQQRAFSNFQFMLWIGLSVVHSLILFFTCYAMLDAQVIWSNGRDGGWLVLGNVCYTMVVLTVSLKALLEADSWTWPLIVSLIGSVLFWFFFLAIYSMIYPTLSFIGADMAGSFRMLVTSGAFWPALLLIPVATLLSDFAIKGYRLPMYASALNESDSDSCEMSIVKRDQSAKDVGGQRC